MNKDSSDLSLRQRIRSTKQHSDKDLNTINQKSNTIKGQKSIPFLIHSFPFSLSLIPILINKRIFHLQTND